MSHSLAWFLLFLAGLLEVSWAIGLKYSNGFTNVPATTFTLCSLMGSMFLLAKATSVLPIGTAYGVWVGIGAVGAGVAGIVLFKEGVSIYRPIFLSLLVISIIGLKLTSKT
jgi:quaternary ammonium compound-resistance protein SugE